MQKKHEHTLESVIKTAGLKLTTGRRAIIEVLLKSPSPLNQDQIAEKLGRRGVNKVTIYRTLESFIKTGILHKAFVKERTWHYELAHNCSHTQCHPHFTCTRCGQTSCLTTASVPLAANLPPGYRLQRQTVELEGLCPDCAASP